MFESNSRFDDVIIGSTRTPSVNFVNVSELVRVNSWMGVTETIIGSAFMGALFGLLCGQPLLIIGCTGPLAVFEGSLYDVVCR